MIWVLWLLACTPPLLPDAAVRDLGAKLCAVGHPKATCGTGRVVAQSHGPLSLGKSAERWVDIAVAYEVADAEHELVLRVEVKKLSPCKVRTRVQSDSGPAPVLLDNAVTSKLAGSAICRELAG